MKRGKLLFGILFLMSVVVCGVSVVLFWNMAIFCDEYNSTPTLICGGTFWLAMDWLRLFLSAALILFSGWGLLKRQK